MEAKEAKKSAKLKYRTEYPSDFNFDYKDPVSLYRFISEGGKIVPSRISKMSMMQQRKIASAIKRARNIALLPSGSQAYDDYQRPQQISPVPFVID